MRNAFRPCSVALCVLALLGACGGGDSPTGPDGGGPGGTEGPAFLTITAGNAQIARIGSSVAVAPAVLVTDASHAPLPNVVVTFAVTGGGGSVSVGTATTNANGNASIVWTLGTTVGPNTLQASVPTLAPANFTATSRLPFWTVLVYIASDNNLSSTGMANIDQIESAGVDPEVQVMIQADVNPTQLQVDGCGGPQGCVNRPNYNSFRYVWSGQGSPHLGPNGPTIDLGANLDFSNPATLRNFIQWATQAAPAQHYALVLWNHGGGYSGLLQDVSTAGGNLMLPGELPTALAGTPHLDVLEFDMCLMGQYETLTAAKGLTDNVVFSEDLEPSPGQHYQLLMQGLYANHAGDGQAFARIMADRFDQGFQGVARVSTTISAYSMAGLAQFEGALASLADSLRVHAGTLAPTISNAAAASQKFAVVQFTDVLNFLDSLSVRTADPVLLSQITAVRSAALDPGFRLRNHVRSGSTGLGASASNVDRSTGLAITLPSGIGSDQFESSGALGLTSYVAQFGNNAWTKFLAAYVGAAPGIATSDQGANRLEVYLVWDTASVRLGSDLDLWVLEPDGNLYAPFVGTVTPDGVFTQDSYLTNTFYEGYLTHQVVLAGTYKFYASLWSDPANITTPVDIQYRTDPTMSLISLYAPNYPTVSMQTSWRNDPGFSLAKVDAGSYTDLRLMATSTFAPTPAPPATIAAHQNTVPLSLSPSGQVLQSPQLTSAQIEVLRRHLRVPRGQGVSASSPFPPVFETPTVLPASSQ